ncbi:MAG: hypothetical protein IPL39_02875 [Opitutaceae bacterium]|nr:hypothetical protein [Opitutaceae bacterium]
MSLFNKRPKKSSATPSTPPPAAPAAAASPAASTPAPASDPSKDPNMIRGFDAFGREVYITRQQWRETILPSHLQKVWENPDQLFVTIQQSLNERFAEEMIAPAEHLAEIDPNHERGAIVLSVVYGLNNRIEEAEQTLLRFIEVHGETSQALSNLAKAQASRGNLEQGLATLWHALELDPNQENGFGWYLAAHHEKGGDAAAHEALLRIATLPASWRARLWLARQALSIKDPAAAVAHFQDALEMAGQPVPAELLVQMSGDLGQAGHLTELVQLTAAHFNAAVHGPDVGGNLMRAHLGLGAAAPARAVLTQLEAQKRPEWQQPIAYWNAELAKAEFVAGASTEPPTLKILVGDGPVWLPSRSLAHELVPVAAATPIAFIGGTAALPNADDRPVVQLSDLPGRVCRALPLFFAEQVRFSTLTPVCPLSPWLQGSHPAWALGKAPWSPQEAANFARSCAPQAEYVVVTHLVATAEPWRLELALIRTSDAVCLAAKGVEVPLENPEPSLRRLSTELLQLLVRHTERSIVRAAPVYSVPTGPAFKSYLLGLEQLLSINFGSLTPAHAHFLGGDREMLDGYLKFCLALPENVVVRLLFLQALAALKEVRPDSVALFRERAFLLQEQKPLPAPAQGVVLRLLAAVYPEGRGTATPTRMPPPPGRASR